MKPGYKQTEVGVIPEDWSILPLGDVAIIKDGTHQTPKYVASGIPFFSVEHVTSGDFKNTKFISEQEHRFLTRSFKIEKGDILMTRIGSIGDCKLIDWEVDASFYVSLALLKIRNGYSARYIAHYSKSAAFQNEIELHSLQSAIPKKINLGPISDVKITVPPPLEQQTIADALSDIESLQNELDALIAKKRDLKRAAMQQLLTAQTRLPGFSGEWTDTTLGKIGECIIGLTYRPEDVASHGLLVLRSSNVQNGRLSYEDNVYVNLNVAPHLYTQIGDLLICVRNGSRTLIGKCAVIDHAAVGLTFGAFMAMYRTKHWRFVVHAFQGDEIQRQIHDNIGATINQITNKDMKAFRIKLPPEAEQTAIATVLSDMDAELAALEARLEKTRALKQGMMQQLLTGQIRLV